MALGPTATAYDLWACIMAFGPMTWTMGVQHSLWADSMASGPNFFGLWADSMAYGLLYGLWRRGLQHDLWACSIDDGSHAATCRGKVNYPRP